MKLIGAIIAVFVVLGGIFMLSQNNSNPAEAATFQKVQADIASGGQLLDVRTPAEYNGGHIDGAINLSLQDIQAGTMPTLAKDKPVYVYCHSGSRSSQAATALKAAGYQNIIDLGPMTHVEAIGGNIKS